MPPRSPEDRRSDEELIRAINRADEGAEAAFGALYRRHRDWVLRLAWRFTTDRDETIDVLQETFAYVLGKFPGFELRAKFTTFLYPVVKNIALSRRRKRRPRLVGEDVLDAVSAPAAEATDDRLGDLATVLGCLSVEHREVVLLRFLEDFQLDEIAAALAVPLGTVKSRLHHALKILRDDPRTRRYFEA